MPSPINPALRLVLALAGAGIVLLGIDNAAGGIATLGWQVSPDFFSVNDRDAFAVRDSHARFLGGVWLAMGLVFVASAIRPMPLARTVPVLCGAIFLGGLLRFTQVQDLSVLVSGDILPSLALELILFPLIGWWTIRETSKDR
ncbi:protein of unknown function [Pseudosulfitobacter pseudonitzschiae]|uniref:DUF4345 domain-containing protein n=1 Tax=Pseudosulfitobacter pseudonitzschiae TaxID=1402135 RepID=A0A073J9A7_9RHOB|nr:DUF4345 domain-containing protein [Pseudosulfitobacter pseudonitzschiae]KEJ94307.1 hypothetical protein SUH3_07270 [Pseudosulfitobacter pseudonitzschiae]QKS11680.1 DUF4345 domain-containing protein [Pseudosulfitobacter pseudonitzschiae]SHG21153.1 protein of unknown function [Pseudosulfitobacter pseudonitzschiae]